MGLAASQGRLLMLTARKSDIEFKIQTINQRRTILAQQSSQLIRQYVDALKQNDDLSILGNITIPENPVIPTGNYETQMALVQSLDKELELRTRDLDTQHKEIEAEYDAVKKVIDKNIEMSFKTLG